MLAGDWGPVFCRVDGVELKNLAQYRCQTPLIDILLPVMDTNLFGVPTAAPTEVLSVGDGVYIFLFPLPIGTHTIEFQNISYTVTVSPR